MEIEKDGIDDVLMDLYPRLLSLGTAGSGTRGAILELLGVLIRIRNPLARVSRSQDRGKPFSALGELLWYLHGSDTLEFIEPYIARYRDDAEDGVIHGAYGPRFHAMRGDINQIGNVISLLEENPQSKRAVIQLFDAADITRRFREIPCTTTMQFLVRDGRLHMSVTMRSNDAYLGLPHDVFCFTMLQEMMARRLRCGLGEYLHYVSSMHVYEKTIGSLEAYLAEGWQKTSIMPEMPSGDPFSEARRVIALEQQVRAKEEVRAGDEFKETYWADLMRLVQVYWFTRRGNDIDLGKADALKAQFVNEFFANFMTRRRRMREHGSWTSRIEGDLANVAKTTK
ncbi:MAG: thymidylate synthase [Agrobacterium cavarae]